MSRERAKILEMVAAGTITPEQGEQLLSRLEAGSAVATVATDDAPYRNVGPLRYLRVVVDGAHTVNIRVPIALVRTGIKLTTLIPREASEHLHEHGIDLSRLNGLDGEELIEALRELHVEVDTGDGDVIRIFCE